VAFCSKFKPAQFQPIKDDRRKLLQVSLFGCVESIARLAVGNTKRADGLTVMADQGCPGIKPDMRGTRNQRIIYKSEVEFGIEYHQHGLGGNGMSAEGDLSLRGAEV
jgi:hypothetical protein